MMSRIQRQQSASAARRASATDLVVPIDLLAASLAVCLAWQSFRPGVLEFLGLSIDRLTCVLGLLVAGIGSVVFRYSVRCLDGHPRRGRFLALLTGAVVSAAALVLAGNLFVLLGAWTASSLCLHGLLTFCRERPEHRRPAWKKFIISRIGDVALLSAVLIIGRQWGTYDLRTFLSLACEASNPTALAPVAVLVALAALTKSAQFPFHSWLPETMESPTPVSALMHAGIINAGGVLLIRFAPAIARVPEAWMLLVGAGTATMVVGMVAMWAQVKVKRTLAWSTVSQMGFMMVQCGLLALPAAVLHIVGHGCYKAWSFLRSGEVVDDRPAHVAPLRAIALVAVGTAASVPALFLGSAITGVTPWHVPGEAALAAMLALGVGQWWAGMLGPSAPSVSAFGARLLGAALTGTVAVVGALWLYGAAGAFLAPALGAWVQPSGTLAWIAAAMPVVATLALIVLHASLPVLDRSERGRAFHVHALHGFYVGAMADRLVDAIIVTGPTAVAGDLDA